MRGKILSRLLGALVALLIASGTHAAVIFTAVESGGDVVFSSSGGSLNLTGLTLDYSGISYDDNINPSASIMGVGDLVIIYQYSGVTSIPSDFGAGGFANNSSSTGGGGLGVNGSGNLFIRAGTGSTFGAISSTYAGETFASLGITAGSYVWSWSGDSITLNVVPVPAAAWLFGSALLGLGWMRRRPTA